MKCPDCGTEVFDVYTTEERIKSLGLTNHTAGWAKTNISNIADMAEDRAKGKGLINEPISMEWLAERLRKISDGIHITT